MTSFERNDNSIAMIYYNNISRPNNARARASATIDGDVDNARSARNKIEYIVTKRGRVSVINTRRTTTRKAFYVDRDSRGRVVVKYFSRGFSRQLSGRPSSDDDDTSYVIFITRGS